MEVKNNYHECLTNLACSIRKYFDLDYKHNTLSYIDEVLEKEKPKNVVIILCDGMGSNILDRTLNYGDFLLEHKFLLYQNPYPFLIVDKYVQSRAVLFPLLFPCLLFHTHHKNW